MLPCLNTINRNTILTLLLYKTIAGILIFITSIIAVAYPIKVRAHPTHRLFLELGDAFASGIFLGAALFHMLPTATQDFTNSLGNMNYPLAELFCAAGFLILLFFERLPQLSHGKNASATLPYILALILIVHSLVEGAALGVNTTLATAFIIFIAIIAHKSSESFALAVTLNRSDFTLRRIIFIVGLFSLMTPLGIALGATLTSFLQLKQGLLLTAIFNAFAAGSFLYMSTLHHINHHQRSHEGEGLLEFMCLLAGLIVMAVVAFWA